MGFINLDLIWKKKSIIVYVCFEYVKGYWDKDIKVNTFSIYLIYRHFHIYALYSNVRLPSNFFSTAHFYGSTKKILPNFSIFFFERPIRVEIVI